MLEKKAKRDASKVPRAKVSPRDKATKVERTLTSNSRRKAIRSSVPRENSYAFETLSEAVHELVTGAGRVQERLAMAMTYLVLVRPEEIPDSALRTILLTITRDLTREAPHGKESRLTATLRTLADEEASAIARCILDLYVELVERCYSSELGHST